MRRTTNLHWPAESYGAARAVTVARHYRDVAPEALLDRHTEWLRWDRRAIVATHIAAAHGVDIDTVIVRDDPDRHYGIADHASPGDLIEITDAGCCWAFVPDPTGIDPLWGWLMLGPCPRCGAPRVPLARVGGLADLGAHLDFEADAFGVEAAPAEFHGDPAHRPDCLYTHPAP